MLCKSVRSVTSSGRRWGPLGEARTNPSAVAAVVSHERIYLAVPRLSAVTLELAAAFPFSSAMAASSLGPQGGVHRRPVRADVVDEHLLTDFRRQRSRE